MVPILQRFEKDLNLSFEIETPKAAGQYWWTKKLRFSEYV